MLPRCITAFILCFISGTLYLQAQDSLLYRQLTIPETRCTLDEALKVIERQTGFSFSYNSGLINKKKTVILAANQDSLIDVLDSIFEDPTLSYSIIGRHLVIYRPFKTQAVNPDSDADSVYYFMISGKVADKDTREVLPFSSVYLAGKTIGIVSNEDGEFNLKLNSSELNETLNISCIGYKTFSAEVASLVNTHHSYYLEPDIISIQEVIIRRISPVMLLQDANERIRANYPGEAAILTSFYRETVQRGNHFTMVSEAILENYKTGYHTTASDRVKILKGRKSEDITRGDSIILKLKAGLNTMLLLDVVKNIPDFLTGESLQDYHYRLADIVVEDGRDNYAVEFNPRKNSPEKSFYSGRIIIDIQDMAFRWIEFQVDPANLALASERFILRKPPDMIVKTLKANYKVAYKKQGGKYYLNMIVCETGFRIRKRRHITGTNYITRLETVVTGIDTLNVNRFPHRETARLHQFFSDQVGAYDEAFWGEYNFITPDESLERALVKMQKRVTGDE